MILGHRPEHWPGTRDRSDFFFFPSSFQLSVWAAPHSKVWRRGSCRFQVRSIRLAFVVLWGTDSEGSREKRSESFRMPLQGHLRWSRNIFVAKAFARLTEDLSILAWLDLRTVFPESGRRFSGETAKSLQGLPYFTFHIKLVNITRHRIFEVYVMLYVMNQAAWDMKMLCFFLNQTG